MIYLPAALLESGMTLARGIPSSNPLLPLMVAGQSLTAASIRMVLARGIKGLYIENSSSDDIVLEEILDPAQKQEMLADIKQEFDKVMRRNAEPDYRTMNKMAESIVMSVLDQDGLLCNVMDIRDYDSYTYSHSLYVGMVGVVLGAHENLPPDQLTDLAIAGLLHDVGKLDIPLEIINKPGPLTDAEYERIKEHPIRAVKYLKNISGCRDSVLGGVASHHECYDGTGYPRGIAGDNIPLYGRILAIADVYDALSSNRSYRKAWTPSQVIDYIISRAGTQFDSELLTAFLRSVTAYPVGSLVNLSDGSIALVIRNHQEFTLRPTVRLLAPPARAHTEIDLSQECFHITILDTVREASNALHLGRF